jgi:hypothetical protein
MRSRSINLAKVGIKSLLIKPHLKNWAMSLVTKNLMVEKLVTFQEGIAMDRLTLIFADSSKIKSG